MSNNLSKPGLRQQAKSANARLQNLEHGLARALVGIEKRFGESTAVANRYGKVLEALVEAVGPELIQEIVTRRSMEEATAISAQEVANLNEGIEEGYLASAETVTESSLIVGHEVDKDGALVGTGRQQVVFKGVAPQSQAELLGKKVGDSLKTPTGGSFEIKEIYAIDEEKAKVVFASKAQAEMDARAVFEGTDEASDAPAPEATEEEAAQ